MERVADFASLPRDSRFSHSNPKRNAKGFFGKITDVAWRHLHVGGENPRSSRRLIVFDNGLGIPPSTSPQDSNMPLSAVGSYRGDLNRFKNLLAKQNLCHRVELILGDICDTVPAFMASRREDVAWCLFDCDLYEPTRVSFKSMSPYFVHNGLLIFHEGLDLEWGEVQYAKQIREKSADLGFSLNWQVNNLSRHPQISARVQRRK